LDSYSAGEHNCLSLDVDDLLHRGVAIKQTDLRGSRSVNTAFQVIAVLFQIQSLVQFGGVATTHIDWTLVPYVRYSLIKHLADIIAYELDKDEDVIKNKIYNKLLKVNKIKYTDADKKDKIDELVHDYMIDFIGQLTTVTKAILNRDDVNKPITRALRRTKRETEQGAEGFIHNCNSLQSRSGMQLPFTSINYGTCTLPEGQMVIDAILSKELDGTGPLHKTPIFPCCIFQWEKSINGYPNTPNYDLFRKALLCTSKRLYPNYANVNWTVDVNNIKKDIDNKKEIITKYETNEDLINWIKTNPKEAIKYRLIVKNNKVCIDEDVFLPFEIMSTMGKCKLQLI
jgi:ribonucleoside-triphosphate reductase